jgi:hypothetical protein
MASGRLKQQPEEKGPTAAWIAAGALVLGAVISGIFVLISPIAQDYYKERVRTKTQGEIQAQSEAATKAAALTPKKKPKMGFCTENALTKETYKFDIPVFYPKAYVDMSKPFGGDAANPGHLFTLKTTAPGLVYKAVCKHDGTSEEIVYCGKDRAALGGDTKVAEISGWINGEGGPTYMTVFYQMPCEVPDGGN